MPIYNEERHVCYCGSKWFFEIRQYFKNTCEVPAGEKFDYLFRIKCVECSVQYERDGYTGKWLRVMD